MNRYLNHLIRSTERSVEDFLRLQIQLPGSFESGRIQSEILEGKPTIYALAQAVAVYEQQNSKFYRSKKLYEAINNALDFIKRYQREDGSFDYPSCNFQSAADTSFCFKRLMYGYRLLEKYDDTEEGEVLKNKYLFIMKKALDAIVIGGFHTPNHRWGIGAALLQGANLFCFDVEFSEKLKNRASEYLREGIDGNEDGEYAERSTGNYNAVVNNSMITMFEETKDITFLGYVKRNLHMMLTYIDSDDSIFTQNSTRQDQGKKEYADKYFYQFLYMASQKAELEESLRKEFDAAAHKIIKDNVERGDIAPDCLFYLMLHDFMLQHEFKQYGFLETYRVHYKDSGVVRVKNHNFCYSILHGKHNFLFIKFKDTPIYVRIGESIGPIRAFASDTIEVLQDDKECVLTSEVESQYYLPFSEAPESSDWWKMDHTKREILVTSILKIQVRIKELEDGIRLHVSGAGLDRVPLRIQVCIPDGSVIENDMLYMKAVKGEGMVLRNGLIHVHHDVNNLTIGPGFGTHEFCGHYNGEERNTDGYTLFFNEYTPFEKQLDIRLNEG